MSIQFDAVRSMSILFAGASMIALGQGAFAQTSTTAETEASEEQAAESLAEGRAAEQGPGNDIVVTGIRASIERGTEKKRKSDQIKDVIDAEDIGKLPDTNVAEALQRVTGVQINRDLGEGSEVSVRGFAQNRVEVNGQTQVGSGASGGPTFQTVPSEGFASIEVIKTPAADEIEGSLGGIVRFNTRKPLDSKKMILSGSAQAQYAKRAGEWAPNFSALFSNAWDVGDGKVGLLVGYTRNRRKLRQDFLEVRGWEAVNGFNRDLDNDGVSGFTTVAGQPRWNDPIIRDANGIITDLGDGAYVPGQTRLQIKEQNRKLDSYNGALQWRTGSGIEFYAIGAYNSNKASDTQFQASNQFNSALEPDPNAVGGGNRIRTVYQQPQNAVISEDHTVLSALLGQLRTTGTPAQIGQPLRGVNFNISGDSNPITQRVFTGQFGVKGEIAERLRGEIQYSIGRGRQVNNFINTTSGIGNLNVDAPFYFYNFDTEDDIPTIVPLNRLTNGRGTTVFDDASRLDLASLANYGLSTAAFTIQRERNNDDALRVDFDFSFDDGAIKSIEYGARVSRTRGLRFRDRVRDSNATAADGTFAGLTYRALDQLLPGVVVAQPYGDVLNGATGDFPRSWLSLDPQYLRDNLNSILQQFGIAYAPDPGWGFNVKQRTQALYGKVNFDFDLAGMQVFGNIGARWVHTDVDATGGVPSGTQANPTLTILNVKREYANFLPSMNVVFRPADKFQVRFGAAQSMARPTTIQLSPFLTVSDSFDTAQGGNPFLKPQKVRQFDLSVEKYFGKGNLISAALFHKRFSERIEQGIQFVCLPIGAGELESTPGNDGCLLGQDRTAAQRPVNVGAATVKGFEIGWQQSLDFLPSPLDGLGFIANYTYVDAGGGSTSATGAILPVQDLSKHSYNLIGYFEKWGFQARAAYNWRSRFYDDRTTTNQASFAKPYGQLDASLGYEISKNISVQFEALNLLNAPEQRYQELEERFLSYRVNDKRFLLGIRIRN